MGNFVQKKDINKIINKLKKENKKIVFTNGCFDILHIGHLTYLREAKSHGDILIVGLNSDDSVKRIKGESRPLNNENDRGELLASLQPVDYVVLFHEDTPIDLIGEIKPDIHIKGGDYKIEDLPEKEVVESNGGKIIIVSLVDGKSTTNIIEKIKTLS